jgi:hypothetical protein
MPAPRRAKSEPTEDWNQFQLRFTWPEQANYELIRPVVLFGRSPGERAQQTGISRRTIYRKVGRFDGLGMPGLAETAPSTSLRALPPVMRQAIVTLKAEHPALRPHELASICLALRRGHHLA